MHCPSHLIPSFLGFWLLVLLLPGRTAAMPPDSLRGWVVDEKGEPLRGAAASLARTPAQGTYTDSNGRFALPLPQPDTLLVTYYGYADGKFPVKPGQRDSFRLAEQVRSVQAVTIEAKPLIAEQFAIQTLRQLDIYRHPSAKADALLAVNALPAGTAIDETANVSLRGGRPDETGLFLNGVPLYDAVRFARLNGIGTFSLFNTALIDKLSVFPAQPPLEYGNATAGLVALETRREIGRRQTQLSLSPANLGLLHHQPLGERHALTAYTNYQPNGLLQGLNPAALGDLERFTSLDGGLHWLYQQKQRQLRVFSYGLGEGFRYRLRHPSYTGSFAQTRWRQYTVAQYEEKLGEGGLTRLSLHGKASFGGADFGLGNLALRSRTQNYYAAAHLHRAQPRWSWKGGLSLDARRQQSEGQVPQFGYALAPEHPAVALATATNVLLPEAYAYARWQPAAGWWLGLGGRSLLPVGQAEPDWSAQLHLSWQPAAGHTLRAGAGRYYQLRPGEDQQLGVNQSRSHQLSLDCGYEGRRLEGLLALFAREVQRPRQRETVFGAEAWLHWQLHPALMVEVAASHLQATVDSAGYAFAAPFDLGYYLKGGLRWESWPGASWQLAWLHRQGRPYRLLAGAQPSPVEGVWRPILAAPDQQSRLPDYGRFDLSFSQLLPLGNALGLILFFSASNLLDRQNVRDLRYGPEYQQQLPELFARRTWYGGVVLQR